jgi:TPP-dependent 2-oxoacid decarboxylase
MYSSNVTLDPKSGKKFTIGKYLGARFEQIGIKHCFMVPGDYNLVLLDQLIQNKNTMQIGCCNELNAAYAAEAILEPMVVEQL